ncbi:MAG: hypothetical protein GF353_15815, partial [Candidatus Lokiarchaeota archaeon]|nr:hypothetical protein [Candidatus Lokiarchaeota archaeon]
MMTRYNKIFQVFNQPYDEKINQILKKIANSSKEIKNALSSVAETKFGLNAILISPLYGVGFKNSLIHVIVFNSRFQPISGADVMITFPKDVNFEKHLQTNQFGSASFHAPEIVNLVQYGKITCLVEKEGKQVELVNYYNRSGADELSDRNVLFTVLTDLEQYQPGQPIYIRGMVWEQDGLDLKAFKSLKVHISLVNPHHQEIIKQTRITDSFGVFFQTFPLEDIIEEGLYSLKFELPELSQTIKRKISIKAFKKPTIKIELVPIESVKVGEFLVVEGKAEYFYGDPLNEGDIRVILFERAGDKPLKEFTIELNRDGKFITKITTEDITP